MSSSSLLCPHRAALGGASRVSQEDSEDPRQEIEVADRRMQDFLDREAEK